MATSWLAFDAYALGFLLSLPLAYAIVVVRNWHKP
jgi:hypothetical protein